MDNCAVEKKPKVKITRAIGIIISVCFAFLVFLFITSAFAELRYTIDPKTFDVTFDYKNLYIYHNLGLGHHNLF